MYKKRRFYIFLIILFLSNLSLCHMAAQGTGETEDTHAHSESRKWKGIDVNTVIGHSEYGTVEDIDFATKGKTIFLYNVGTGRFIIEGGNWGMEGRLFHEDFGRPLYLMSDGFIRSGITEKETKKYLFGCNVPGELHKQGNWNGWDQYSFTVMMDADQTQRLNGGWNFDRVPGETGDTYTYYMYEIGKTGKRVYLGAAWGECHAKKWKDDFGNPRESNDVDDFYVLMDYDRACWTSKSNPSPCGDMTEKEVDGDMITIDELYQWRVVSKEEFLGVLEKEEIGLNPSVSVLVPDRDFTRNTDNFDSNWIMEADPNGDYSEKGHYGFTYGVYLNKKKQTEYNDNEFWNKPIRLKNVFDNSDVSGGDMKYGWKYSKNGFLTFEGVGRTYTSFKVPKAGWYQVQCYGFVQSEQGHNAYLFAKVANSSSESSYGGEITNNLVTVSADTHINIDSETGNYGNYTVKNVRDNCRKVGEELRTQGESYKNTVWICVTDDKFVDGQEPLMMVGVGKDEATQSGKITKNNNTYSYDTDWVCIDDIRVSYFGTSPAFFYEEEENLDYLIPGSDNTKQFETSSPSNFGASEGQYGGAVCIERSLKKNQWNSFSFPMPVTGEQMRHAFGEDAQLARIHGIGTMSNNPNVIDFKTVSLRTTEPVVEPGNFYLLKPTKDPTKGIDPQGRNTTYYELGRFFFTVNENEPATYTSGLMNLSKKMDNETQEIKLLDALNGEIVGNAGVNYVRTPGYKSFSVSGGVHYGDEAMGIYATKGSYAVSNNTIYHLAKDTPLKGFRGWITLEEPVGQQAKDFTMEVFGIFDKEPVSVATDVDLPRIQILNNDEAVYDLSGRKVGNLGSSLPKGLYIVRGKKYLVK